MKNTLSSALAVTVSTALSIGVALGVLSFSTLMAERGRVAPSFSTDPMVPSRTVVLARYSPSGRLEPVFMQDSRTTATVASFEELQSGIQTVNEGTTWTVMSLGASQRAVFLCTTKGQQESHWNVYDPGTTAGLKLLLSHVAVANLRQRATLEMTHLGYGTAPALVGDSLFWRGPRVLTYGQAEYGPSRDLLVVASAGLQMSWLSRGALLACLLIAMSAGSGLSRHFVRDASLNFATIITVLVALRLGLALFLGDFWYTTAWLSPVIGAGAFLTVMFLALEPQRARRR